MDKCCTCEATAKETELKGFTNKRQPYGLYCEQCFLLKHSSSFISWENGMSAQEYNELLNTRGSEIFLGKEQANENK